MTEEEEEFIDKTKQRHGCVTAWLYIAIIAHLVGAFVFIFGRNMIVNNLPQYVPSKTIMLLGFLYAVSVIFLTLLSYWKKIGFWGFLVTRILISIISISSHFASQVAVLDLISLGVLYWILQLKTKDGTGWQNLE